MRAYAALGILWLGLSAGNASAAPALTPSGEALTPLAAPQADYTPLNPHLAAFPSFVANQAANMAESPGGRTLLVLTSGFNQLDDAAGNVIPSASNQYVFVFDIAGGAPVERQVLKLPNSYMGLAFGPGGRHFYVSGGVDGDVHIFARTGSGWAEIGAPIALGLAGPGWVDKGLGLRVPATAGNLAVTADGKRLVVADFENDEVSIIDLVTRAVRNIPLRPGLISKSQTGVAGGEYPFGIAIAGNRRVYVSSLRDREVDVLRLDRSGLGAQVVQRIKVVGNPGALLLNHAGTSLFVACDNDGKLAVVDTRQMRVVSEVSVTAPHSVLAGAPMLHGTGANGLALSPNERTLFVTDGGTNAVTSVFLAGSTPRIEGLIPAGFYPDAVRASRWGWLYIANAKSIADANPGNCNTATPDKARAGLCEGHNAYVLQRLGAGLLAMPVARCRKPCTAYRCQVTYIKARMISLCPLDIHSTLLRTYSEHFIVYRSSRTQSYEGDSLANIAYRG